MNDFSITVQCKISNSDLQEALSSLSDNYLFDLIKGIDSDVADWDFTRRLSEHFNNEMDALDKEEA